MAQECGFFNAKLEGESYDRVYLAEQFAAYFAAFIGNGIYGKSMQKLRVLCQDNPDMSIKVLSGEAYINGWWYRNTDTYNLQIPIADGVLSRIDVIVLRWGSVERDMWLQVISGTPSANPVKPAIRRDADYYDLQLATINVMAGLVRITQSQIQDTRLDNSVCGLVTGVVDQIDTTNLYNQFESYFEEFKTFYETDYEQWTAEQKQSYVDFVNGAKSDYDSFVAQSEADYEQWTTEQQTEYREWYNSHTTQWTEEFLYWFENVKDKLTDDAAGNLQNQIDEQYVQLTAYTDKAISDLIGGAPETLDTLKEVADAIAENESVVDALNQAIGTKASQAELDTHTGNTTIHITSTERKTWSNKQEKTGDSKDNVVTFTSGDVANPTDWTAVALLVSGEKHSSISSKLSNMFKNIRWLKKVTDKLNTDLVKVIQIDGPTTVLFTADWAYIPDKVGHHLLSVNLVYDSTDRYIKAIQRRSAGGYIVLAEGINGGNQAVWFVWGKVG